MQAAIAAGRPSDQGGGATTLSKNFFFAGAGGLARVAASPPVERAVPSPVPLSANAIDPVAIRG